MGSIITADQFACVTGMVDEVKASKHLEIVTGGSTGSGNGFFFEPTLIANTTQDDRVIKEEIFGPVVTASRFSSVDDAIAWANDTRYGLSASSGQRMSARRCRLSPACVTGSPG